MNKILLSIFINVTIYDLVSFTVHVLDIIYINHSTQVVLSYIGNDYTAWLCICDNYTDCGLL